MVIVITTWWNGYECAEDQVDISKFKIMMCNSCLKPMGIFIPIEWDRPEVLCYECENDPDWEWDM